MNFIVAHTLDKHKFTKLLDDVDSQFSGLIMYNKVRWFRRGQLSNRIVELLDEVRNFLSEKVKEHTELTDISQLLADFTLHFNKVNTKLKSC